MKGWISTMEKLTKAALVEHMVKEMGEGVTKKEAAAALDALCRVIPAQMAAGNAVVLPGIGSLEVKQRPERQGYDGVKSLCNHLLFKQNSEKVNLMPIDILLKENLKYYLNNKL